MTDIQKLKALAEDCEPSSGKDRLTPGILFQSAANPAAVLELITELEKVKADRKACWEEFKVQGRQLDLVKDENDNLRKDARRWQCVRNAIPMQSPYAVWREGSHLVLGKDADELVDNFLSHAKEASHD